MPTSTRSAHLPLLCILWTCACASWLKPHHSLAASAVQGEKRGTPLKRLLAPRAWRSGALRSSQRPVQRLRVLLCTLASRVNWKRRRSFCRRRHQFSSKELSLTRMRCTGDGTAQPWWPWQGTVRLEIRANKVVLQSCHVHVKGSPLLRVSSLDSSVMCFRRMEMFRALSCAICAVCCHGRRGMRMPWNGCKEQPSMIPAYGSP